MKTHICQISVRTSFLIFAFQMYGCKGLNVFISLDPIYLVVRIFSLICGTQSSLTCFYAFFFLRFPSCDIPGNKYGMLVNTIDFCSILNCAFFFHKSLYISSKLLRNCHNNPLAWESEVLERAHWYRRKPRAEMTRFVDNEVWTVIEKTNYEFQQITRFYFYVNPRNHRVG